MTDAAGDGGRWEPSDPYFGPPVVLVDEVRERPYPHRYLHGAFDGTETTFSYYYPADPSCGGRFLHYLGPGPGGIDGLVWSGAKPSLASTGVDFPSPSIAFAARCGAYLVESNQGFVAGKSRNVDPRLVAYRASAEVARLGARLARRVYGRLPEHGYVFGGSGGGRRAILALENVEDVWDGAVPFLVGADGPDTNAIVANAIRLLGGVEADLAWLSFADEDSLEQLTSEARSAVARLAELGVPASALHALAVSGIDLGLSLALLSNGEVEQRSSGEMPGGQTNAPEALLFRATTRLMRVVTAAELAGLLETSDDALVWRKLRTGYVPPDSVVAFEVDREDMTRWRGSTLRMETGVDAGRVSTCIAVLKNLVVTALPSGSFPNATMFDGARAGDLVTADNRSYLAFCLAEGLRHRADAAPTPLRPTGSFSQKMIHVNAMHDFLALPERATGYARLVAAAQGDRLLGHYRLWFVDNASHYPPSVQPCGPRPVVATRLVDYAGVIEQAITDVIAWVEAGQDPPAGAERVAVESSSTPSSAGTTIGNVQASVTLTANGNGTASVAPGSEVELVARAAVASEVGQLIAAEWDFEGTGAWRSVRLDEPVSSLEIRVRHAFDEPGRYRSSVRVWTHRGGDTAAQHCRIANLAHATVLVEP